MKRKNKVTSTIFSILILLCIAVIGTIGYSHCQVPCGIYGDPTRIDIMAEHIRTIEKSMNQINELTQEDKPDMNQLVRWIDNKDLHADKLNEIITYYFMAQRITPAESGDKNYQKYIDQLTTLHKMQVQSMKSKQTTNLQHVKNLRELLDRFEKLYFGKKVTTHSKDHNHDQDEDHGHSHEN